MLLLLPALLRRLPCLALACLCLPALAGTLTVPAQYPTIQAAVSAAGSGDTVLIADGTYTGPGNVDIDFGGKNLTVTSQHGAASTIIDCGGSASANHRGFYLHSGETSPVISGLTIQNGYEIGDNQGGGINVVTSGVTIRSCVLKNNTSGAGGGIYEGNYNSTFAVTNCVFIGNKAVSNANGLQLGYGGGLYNYTSVGTIRVTNCTFTGNSATGGGGGMNDAGGYGSTISVTNDLLYGDSGVELLGSGSGDTVSFCDVQGGYTGSGNFIGNINADPKFANTPADLHLQAGSPCLGAGTASGAPTTTIDGQTRPNPPSIGAYEALAGNAAASITLTSEQNPSLPTQYVSFTARVSGAGARPTGIVTFTVDGVAQPSAALFGTSASTSVRFDSPGSHSITAVYSGDAVYASSTSSVLTQVVAKGATTTAVTASANPSVFGQSITFTATLTQGTASAGYTPTGTMVFTVDGAAQAPVALSGAAYTTASLAVGMHTITATYSGDAVLAGSVSPVLTQTVSPHLSPQYVSPTGSDSNPGTVTAPKLTIQAAINSTLSGDTVLVEDGTYTGPGNVDIDFGGKNITVTSQNGAAKTIIDCGGSSTVNHRGFYLHTGETNAVISGLTIQNGEEGGSYPGSNNYPGGGIYNLDASLTLQNCIIRNNIASQGGGLYNSIYRGTVLVTNCVFTGNTASSGSAYADNSEGGTTSIVNCTITGNIATGSGGSFGGAINSYDHPYPQTASILTLTNDIVYGDTGGEVVNAAAVNAAANNCDIQGSYPGTGNLSADPLFISATDLHLQAGSPCGGAGTAGGAPATDIEGMTRPTPPSIGAYEVSLPTFLVNDTDSGIIYTGGWFYSYGRGAGDFRDDVHAASSSGASLSYSFIGTGVSYLTETNSDEGTVAVSIDGVLKQTVNCYSASRSVQQSVYSINGLAPGLHSIKLVKTGGSYLLLDAFRVVYDPLAVPVNIINDTDSSILYTGPSGSDSWFYSPGRGIGDVGDDVHAASMNGSYLLYHFNGTAISYVSETNSDEGNVDVILDNVFQTTVSCYSAAHKARQIVWSKSGLSPGPHTLLLGKHDGQYLLLDALLVTPSATLVNDTDGGFTYNGGWFYSYGRGVNDLSDDVHATRNNGDSVSYPFTGTSVSYLTETNSDEGTVAVYIDGVLKQNVNCATPMRQVQQTVYSVSGLAPGSHTLTLVKISGTYMVLDGVTFK